jgi:hypothetical protein
MLSFAANIRIFLHARPTDMRKSFDGLCGLVRGALAADPLDGSLFLFIFWRILSARANALQAARAMSTTVAMIRDMNAAQLLPDDRAACQAIIVQQRQAIEEANQKLVARDDTLVEQASRRSRRVSRGKRLHGHDHGRLLFGLPGDCAAQRRADRARRLQRACAAEDI